MRTEQGFFDSHNQTDRIAYTIKTPIEVLPRAVVFVLHGMGSHRGHYESFADFLCENGYVAVTYDQAGHGQSVSEGGLYGSFGASDGDVVLVKDLDTLITLLRRRYRHLPFFVYGHSLGSFVARTYAAAHPETLSGALYSGTCEAIHPSFLTHLRLKHLVKKAKRRPSAKVEKLMLGDYVAAYPEEGSWITTNTEAWKKRKDDPFCGHPLCADAFYDMYKLMRYLSGEKWINDYPKSLPTLFLSGERDPLGGCGEGIRALCEALHEADASDVSCILYPNEKHETLGSLSDARVRADILAFLSEKTQSAVEMQNTAFFSGTTPNKENE